MPPDEEKPEFVDKKRAAEMIALKGYGRSERQVERLAERGLLEKQTITVEGKRRPFYSVASIEALSVSGGSPSPSAIAVMPVGEPAAAILTASAAATAALVVRSIEEQFAALRGGAARAGVDLIASADATPEPVDQIYIGLHEATRLSGVPMATIRDQAERKKIRAIRDGGQVRVHRDDLPKMVLKL